VKESRETWIKKKEREKWKETVLQETNRAVKCVVGSKEWRGGRGKEIIEQLTKNKDINKVGTEQKNMKLRNEKLINYTKKTESNIFKVDVLQCPELFI
jgi:uncharacterized protein YacL